jgi:hypothetical protein
VNFFGKIRMVFNYMSMFRNCVRKTVEVSTMFKHTRGLSLRHTDFDYPFFIFKLFLFDLDCNYDKRNIFVVMYDTYIPQ